MQSTEYLSRFLSAFEIDLLAQFYKKKKGIRIFKNGETEYGKQMSTKLQLEMQRAYEEEVSLFRNELRYLFYLQKIVWIAQMKHTKLKSFLMKNGFSDAVTLMPNLSADNIKSINDFISLDAELKENIESEIQEYIVSKNRFYSRNSQTGEIRCTLTDEDAWEEVKLIQGRLQDNEIVGYVYTNQTAIEARHFEVILISRHMIIKPITWGNQYASFTLRADRRSSSVCWDEGNFVKTSFSLGPYPCPQKDRAACGTLGMLYLKELLKEQASQLHEYTLNLPFYDQDGNLNYFFFPSPHVLRYSQSEDYNLLIYHLIKNELETYKIIKNTCVVGEYYSIQQMLQNTKEQALAKDDKSVIQEVDSLLERLEDFRDKWCAAYAIQREKRSLMNMSTGQTNRYLTYATYRLAESAQKMVEQSADAAASTKAAIL